MLQWYLHQLSQRWSIAKILSLIGTPWHCLPLLDSTVKISFPNMPNGTHKVLCLRCGVYEDDSNWSETLVCRWNAVRSEITGLLCPSHGWIWRPQSVLTPLATSRNSWTSIAMRFRPMFIRHQWRNLQLTVISSHIGGFEPEEFGDAGHPVEQNTRTQPSDRVLVNVLGMNSQDWICCHCRPKKNIVWLLQSQDNLPSKSIPPCLAYWVSSTRKKLLLFEILRHRPKLPGKHLTTTS